MDLSNPYSIDENLWGRSIECGVLDLPDQEPPSDVFEWTAPSETAPEKPEYITITFEEGIPQSVDDDHLAPAELIKNLNEIAGKHGVGRIDHMEDRLVGIKSREVYECPAATVLLEAHHDLEKMVLTKHEIQFKQTVDAQWTSLVYNGLWTDPLREDLEAFINETQVRVSGSVKLKLYKGGVRIVGRSSPMSLYDHDLATYNIGTSFDQAWSQGFIEIWGLQTRMANLLKRKMEKS